MRHIPQFVCSSLIVLAVLTGNAECRTVRVYERCALEFEGTEDALTATEMTWKVTEKALVADDGLRLPRVPGHIAYWFGWNSHFGVKSDVYG